MATSRRRKSRLRRDRRVPSTSPLLRRDLLTRELLRPSPTRKRGAVGQLHPLRKKQAIGYAPVFTRRKRENTRQIRRLSPKAVRRAMLRDPLIPLPTKKIVAYAETDCYKRARRKAVLLSIGRVNRPGGAPGPYRKPSKVVCK